MCRLKIAPISVGIFFVAGDFLWILQWINFAYGDTAFTQRQSTLHQPVTTPATSLLILGIVNCQYYCPLWIHLQFEKKTAPEVASKCSQTCKNTRLTRLLLCTHGQNVWSCWNKIHIVIPSRSNSIKHQALWQFMKSARKTFIWPISGGTFRQNNRPRFFTKRHEKIPVRHKRSKDYRNPLT